MSRQAWCVRRPFGARAYTLLVLAVLAGLLCMHGLGPAVPSPAASHAAVVSGHGHDMAAAASHAAHATGQGCVRVDPGDGGTGGHAEHADSTCAAGGITTAPATPALAAAAVPGCGTTHPRTAVSTAAPGVRAPPSLSELQLLRV
ncbi:DUF6153 family protein [Streptomyces sp. SP18CS02]|uniref:DUF6153 family protein n=1 Tax=Streptomyces sp. SP18CS02 TaxID=3002531 RepID=UPI002E788686|nr:DUF6153 family protein [Streptomyces sp. SP18CS02]MEE1755481.1 DUF6153 family protein [Streptomyces sp. SP18CS02]